MTKLSPFAREALIEIVRARSFSRGTATKLASGRVSDFYFNMKPTMLHPKGGELIAQLILAAIADDEAELVGGLEMGAVPIATAVSVVSCGKEKSVAAFFVRKQAKEHGTQSLVEGLPKGETLAGRKVVVVEDVTTTGGSALQAVQVIRAEGGTVVRVVTVVDRLEGAAAAFKAANLSFTALLTRDDFAG